MIYQNMIELIGNTPIVKLNSFESSANLYIKLEGFNPGGSIKDRAALGMILDAQKNNTLKKDSIILEPTSGNTGIGLSMIGKLLGYKVVIIMPDSMSIERINTMKAYGSEVILTPGQKGMAGAIELAEEMAKNDSRYFIPSQFSNPSNPKIHYETTAVEILNSLPEIDAFVAGVGTGGTIVGVSRKLKESKESVFTVAVEPETSPVISKGIKGAHKIQGIGAGFITDIYDSSVIDEVITISDEKAFEVARELAQKEGIFVGISTGANVASAIEISKKYPDLKNILTIAPDSGAKYLSTDLFK